MCYGIKSTLLASRPFFLSHQPEVCPTSTLPPWGPTCPMSGPTGLGQLLTTDVLSSQGTAAEMAPHGACHPVSAGDTQEKARLMASTVICIHTALWLSSARVSPASQRNCEKSTGQHPQAHLTDKQTKDHKVKAGPPS